MKKNESNLPSLSLTLLGTGTSQGVPVIGCDCPVCTSTDPKDKRLRTAALIRYGALHVAIDCGPDFRQQMLANQVGHLDAILVTHEHNDHIIGLDDVRPFNFRQRKDMPVYCQSRVCRELEQRFAYVFATQNRYPGAPMIQLVEIDANQQLDIEGLTIQTIPVMHGQLPILGFRFGPITYLTDVRTLSPEAKALAKDSEVLVINALHHEPHYSHLNLEQALSMIEELTPQRAYLTHMSHRMGRHADIQPQLPENVRMGWDGLEIRVG